jgi:hypothetical protein
MERREITKGRRVGGKDCITTRKVERVDNER